MANEWHSRGYIPHWEQGIAPQTITFRLADSLPSSLLEQWRGELEKMPDNERMLERRRRIQIALDLGRGESWLANAVIANIVENALLHFDGQRYRLHAWVIMPNHVHVLATLLEGSTLSAVMHSLKSFTASKSNKHLRRGGLFWAPEYFDRAIRDQAHYSSALAYIAMNPVKARLCALPEDWRFSSVWSGRKSGQGCPRSQEGPATRSRLE